MGLADIDNSAQVTIREAAELAGVSIKAIRLWIKQGKIRAEKVEGKFGPTYAIWRDSIPTGYASDGLPVESQREVSTDSMVGSSIGLRQAIPGVSMTELYQELQTEHMKLQREHGAAEALLTKVQLDLDFLRNQIPALESHAKALETQAIKADLLEKQAITTQEELQSARAQIPELAKRAGKVEILEQEVVRTESELRNAQKRMLYLYIAITACIVTIAILIILRVQWKSN
jgi:excisionase family DNA binding protein